MKMNECRHLSNTRLVLPLKFYDLLASPVINTYKIRFKLIATAIIATLQNPARENWIHHITSRLPANVQLI